ncbi:hypothetical protein PPL_12317 [Heterostelium album PN500]|uniref:Uncharacterized protein n=1 Tax=Heterostelium pallidum (strain ATCC 26659 / Pp 5 / PN500) TaxID=670386 RepID=D3BMA7_HETP5|nr:hypothetical protein PPL_12317 [Heterostelium album PN500]EFA77708.1 hypothetical protein PPL_12317 [Heterostelium album PN500]|eukprot:XP_020429836.1 hypothetical protein PPL_12317 [Heterostelium album PN500]
MRQIKYSDLNKVIAQLKLENKFSYIYSTPVIESFINLFFETGKENPHLLNLGYQLFRASQKVQISFSRNTLKAFQNHLLVVQEKSGQKIPSDVFALIFGGTESSTKQLLDLEHQLQENPSRPITSDDLKLYQVTPKKNDHFIELGIQLFIQHHSSVNGTESIREYVLSDEIYKQLLTGSSFILKKVFYLKKLFGYLTGLGRSDIIRDYITAGNGLATIVSKSIDVDLLYYILISYTTAKERVEFLKQTTFQSIVGRHHLDLETLLRSDSTEFFEEPALLNILDMFGTSDVFQYIDLKLESIQ